MPNAQKLADLGVGGNTELDACWSAVSGGRLREGGGGKSREGSGKAGSPVLFRASAGSSFESDGSVTGLEGAVTPPPPKSARSGSSVVAGVFTAVDDD